jgi:signal transduction histidine kinase
VWPKELRIFALTLTASAAIHLALMLRQRSMSHPPHPLLVGGIYGVGLALGAANSLTYFGPLEIWIHSFRAGYLYICVGALSFLWITASTLRRTESDLERSRLRVMFVGALAGFLIPAVTAVLVSSFRVPIPYNVALVPTVFFPISVAYALLKYSLFDLGNALRVALSRLSLMGLLIGIYAAVALLLAPWARQYTKEPLVPIFFSVVVVAIFNPLLRWLEGVVDRYVYQQEYDSAQVQEDVSLFLRSLAAAPVVAQGFIERVTKRLGIATAVVVYRPKNSDDFIAAASASRQLSADTLAVELDPVSRLWGGGDYRGIIRSEVASHPRFAHQREVLAGFLDRWQSELLMPLVYERAVRGIAFFGAKQSGGEFSSEDFRLLRTLTEQLALSLENGCLYQESLQAYARVETSNKKLIEMDRVKKDFVANICHELRTPVTTIIGFGEVLRESKIDGDARDILNRLVNNGQELSQLMDSLMNYSRMEADGSSAQIEVVKLKEILTGLEMMTHRLIRERPIQFGVHLEPTLETIESDGQKLQQILMQLLTNALKFTERGKIDLNLRRLYDDSKEFIEIAVADTGIGIKPEDQETIFEDFRQLDGSSTRQYGGTGLGLGLCKKLAAALGGEIRLSSEVGVGSVFSLRLPVKSPAVQPSPLTADAANLFLQ